MYDGTQSFKKHERSKMLFFLSDRIKQYSPTKEIPLYICIETPSKRFKRNHNWYSEILSHLSVVFGSENVFPMRTVEMKNRLGIVSGKGVRSENKKLTQAFWYSPTSIIPERMKKIPDTHDEIEATLFAIVCIEARLKLSLSLSLFEHQ